MTQVYIPPFGILDDTDDLPDGTPVSDLTRSEHEERYLLADAPNVFHVVKVDLEPKPIQTIACKKCGSNQFNVGIAFCLTVIRCVNCEWEIPIHEG